MLANRCKRGVRVIAVTQQIDLSGPVGHMIASLLFGIALAKKRGVYTGCKPGTTKAAPAHAQALRKQKLTIPEIAHTLGVKERTIYNYLSNGR